MKTSRYVFLIPALISLGLAGVPAVEAGGHRATPGSGAYVELPVYYQELAPYGAWSYLESCGWFWQPSVCDTVSGWRPYVNGGAWSRSGGAWRWSSRYAWGRIPFHYGSWLSTPSYGWVWFPGTEWSGARVEWRRRGTHYGWAPCAPELSAAAYVGMGFSSVNGSITVAYGYGADGYLYVPSHYMTSSSLYARCYSVGVTGTTGSMSVSLSYRSTPTVSIGCAPTAVIVPVCPPPRVVCAPPAVIYRPAPVVYVHPPVYYPPQRVVYSRPPVVAVPYGVPSGSVTVSTRQTATSSAVNVKTRKSSAVSSPGPSRRGSAVRRVTQIARR